MGLLVLALETVLLITVEILSALLGHRLVQRCAAAHGELVPNKSQ